MGRKPKYGSRAQTDAERAKRARDRRRQAKVAQAAKAFSITYEAVKPGIVVHGGSTYDLSQFSPRQVRAFFKAVNELQGLDALHWRLLTGRSAKIEGTTTIALNAASAALCAAFREHSSRSPTERGPRLNCARGHMPERSTRGKIPSGNATTSVGISGGPVSVCASGLAVVAAAVGRSYGGFGLTWAVLPGVDTEEQRTHSSLV
jgi:hypothetical protein